MAKNAQAVFGFQCIGDGVNDSFTPASEFTYSNPNAPPPGSMYLIAGANTVGVAPGTQYGVYLKWPKGSTNPKLLKGVSGDTGIKLHTYCTFFLSLDPSQTSFVLVPTNPELVELYWD